jgi:hypothetical protein
LVLIEAYVGGEEVTHSDRSAPHRGACQLKSYN